MICSFSRMYEQESLGPTKLFIRIDDFGPLTYSIRYTLETLLKAGLSVHVAVVPAWLDPNSARLLCELHQNDAYNIEIGQHGYRHTEKRDGKCRFEVGPGMSDSKQRAVITRGRDILHDRLGFATSPVFVPPFNGFDQITVEVMAELGFRILSAEHRPSPIRFPAQIHELSINVDAIASYFPPQLKSVSSLIKEIEFLSLRGSYVGILLHPDLIQHSRDWIDALVKYMVHYRQYKSVTLCELSDAIDIK